MWAPPSYLDWGIGGSCGEAAGEGALYFAPSPSAPAIQARQELCAGCSWMLNGQSRGGEEGNGALLFHTPDLAPSNTAVRVDLGGDKNPGGSVSPSLHSPLALAIQQLAAPPPFP